MSYFWPAHFEDPFGRHLRQRHNTARPPTQPATHSPPSTAHHHARHARVGMDSDAYLEPGFDPNTLKVAELRGILLKHDVDYPSSAKKAVLLDLFNHHITANAARIRAASAQVLPPSHNISYAGETPEPRRVRRSTRGATEDTTEDSDDARLRGSRRSVGRTPSRRRAPNGEPQQQQQQPPPSTARRTRKSSVMPPDDEPNTPLRLQDGPEAAAADTPFSSHNLFQMGSPPPPGLSGNGVDRRKVSCCFLFAALLASVMRPQTNTTPKDHWGADIQQETNRFLETKDRWWCSASRSGRLFCPRCWRRGSSRRGGGGGRLIDQETPVIAWRRSCQGRSS